MPLQRVTLPTEEHLTRAEEKQQLRVTTTDEDELVSALVAAARQFAETKCQRQIMAARWKYVIDSFPGPALYGVPFGKTLSIPEHAIVLPIGPVLQVINVQYTDLSGNTQTLSAGQANDYIVETSGQITRLTPPFGKIC